MTTTDAVAIVVGIVAIVLVVLVWLADRRTRRIRLGVFLESDVNRDDDEQAG